MEDKILKTLNDNKLVIWEESARDGAQAKTIMTGKDRVKVALATASIFGDNAVDHLVFGVGFPSICKEEFEAIRMVVDKVDNCYLAPNCRSFESEVKLSIDSVKGAKYGRVGIVMPSSPVLTDIMYHLSLKDGMEKNLELLKYALDNSNGMPIDPQFTDITSVEPEFLADYINKSVEIGAATVCLADSFGRFYPQTAANYFARLNSRLNPGVQLYTHFHNDLGLALANNIEAMKHGVNLISTSWLGLGERSGLLATELFLFLMAYESDKLNERFGLNRTELFYSQPNLKKIYSTAHLVSEVTKVPLKVTDPIVGTGVNSISTGTPFINPVAFQPFDTAKVLGAKQVVYASQLANSRVITTIASNIGLTLEKSEIKNLLNFIKSNSYKQNVATYSDDEIKELIIKMRSK